jgi:hypothetical protein
MSNITDWLTITIKFRGKCIECNKEIRSGEQALWSKSTKSIKHLDCSISSADQVTANKDEEESVTHKQEKQSVIRKQNRYLQTTVAKCFICGNNKTRDDENISDYDYYNDYRGGEIESHSYICQSCLQSEDAFQAYQNAFLQKINRYLK